MYHELTEVSTLLPQEVNSESYLRAGLRKVKSPAQSYAIESGPESHRTSWDPGLHTVGAQVTCANTLQVFRWLPDAQSTTDETSWD